MLIDIILPSALKGIQKPQFYKEILAFFSHNELKLVTKCIKNTDGNLTELVLEPKDLKVKAKIKLIVY